jgi:hypothetical protein
VRENGQVVPIVLLIGDDVLLPALRSLPAILFASACG